MWLIYAALSLYVDVLLPSSFLHVNNDPARKAMHLITQQHPLDTHQIFNPAIAKDGVFSLRCIQDGESSFQIYALKHELENTVRYYTVSVRGDGCDV